MGLRKALVPLNVLFLLLLARKLSTRASVTLEARVEVLLRAGFPGTAYRRGPSRQNIAPGSYRSEEQVYTLFKPLHIGIYFSRQFSIEGWHRASVRRGL